MQSHQPGSKNKFVALPPPSPQGKGLGDGGRRGVPTVCPPLQAVIFKVKFRTTNVEQHILNNEQRILKNKYFAQKKTVEWKYVETLL